MDDRRYGRVRGRRARPHEEMIPSLRCDRWLVRTTTAHATSKASFHTLSRHPTSYFSSFFLVLSFSSIFFYRVALTVYVGAFTWLDFNFITFFFCYTLCFVFYSLLHGCMIFLGLLVVRHAFPTVLLSPSRTPLTPYPRVFIGAIRRLRQKEIGF